MTATIQPGIIWEKLDEKLKKQSLTLRLISFQLSWVYSRRLAGSRWFRNRFI